MSDSIDWRIIDRHIAGESTPAEDEQLRRWLTEDPRHPTLLAGLRTAGRAAGEGQRWDVDAAWSKVMNRIADGSAARPLVLHPRREEESRVKRRGLRAVGATLGVLAAALVIGVVWRPQSASF